MSDVADVARREGCRPVRRVSPGAKGVGWCGDVDSWSPGVTVEAGSTGVSALWLARLRPRVVSSRFDHCAPGTPLGRGTPLEGRLLGVPGNLRVGRLI